MSWLARHQRFAEAACGALGIAALGWVNIPLAGWLFGVQINASQALGMSLYFTVGRFFFLYALRVLFSRGRA